MIKQLLDEWPRVKEEISPWPWESYSAICCPDMGGVSGPKGKVCQDKLGRYGHPMEIQDAQFIASAPQNYDLLVQALGEAKDICKLIEEENPGACCGCPAAKKIEAYAEEWLTKWGFQEEGKC